MVVLWAQPKARNAAVLPNLSLLCIEDQVLDSKVLAFDPEHLRLRYARIDDHLGVCYYYCSCWITLCMDGF